VLRLHLPVPQSREGNNGEGEDDLPASINQPLQILIRQLNPALRGWCAYFRPGVSAATFADLARYTRDRIIRWARRKHRRITWKAIQRRYCTRG